MGTIVGKKVCIVHPGNPRFDLRLKKTIKMLANAGADVYVLAYLSRPENDIVDWEGCTSLCRPRPYTTIKASENKIWILRVLWNITVVRIQSMLDRGVGCCGGLAKIALELDVDWYHCINVDGAGEYIKVAKHTNRPIVYESYEYFPEELQRENYSTTSNSKVLYAQERELVSRRASRTVVVGEEIAQGYKRHYGGQKPDVIHNIALTRVDAIRPTGDLVKFYFQSYLRPTYNIEGLIEAFELTEGPATLTIQGHTFEKEYRQILQERIRTSSKRSQIFLLKACPSEEVVQTAHQYDVGMISIDASTGGVVSASTLMALPNKLFTYASAGIAMGISDYPAQERILKGFKMAEVFSPGSTLSISETMQTFIDKRKGIDAMKQESLRFAEEYSFEGESKKMIEIIESALGSKNEI